MTKGDVWDGLAIMLQLLASPAQMYVALVRGPAVPASLREFVEGYGLPL